MSRGAVFCGPRHRPRRCKSHAAKITTRRWWRAWRRREAERSVQIAAAGALGGPIASVAAALREMTRDEILKVFGVPPLTIGIDFHRGTDPDRPVILSARQTNPRGPVTYSVEHVELIPQDPPVTYGAEQDLQRRLQASLEEHQASLLAVAPPPPMRLTLDELRTLRASMKPGGKAE